MKDLIAALESASGPDRELDCDIARSLGWEVKFQTDMANQFIPYAIWGNEKKGQKGPVPYFTESIDAALMLVRDGWVWQVSNRAPKPHAGRAYIHNGELHFVGVGTQRNPDRQTEECTAATPAIALCIAALKARSTQE